MSETVSGDGSVVRNCVIVPTTGGLGDSCTSLDITVYVVSDYRRALDGVCGGTEEAEAEEMR